MMRASLFALLLSCGVNAALAGQLTVLNYHDVTPTPGDDRFAISRAEFVAQMDYLQQHDFHPISLSYLEQVVVNKAPLPKNAVLLTFDDGLKSYREFVAPVLQIYQFPSVISVVTAWLDGVDIPAEYRDKVMSWSDLQEVSDLALVDVGSHTHDMHRGIQANAQNNLRGAATTRQYREPTRDYENESTFRERLRRDLSVSIARLEQQLNITPIAIAWPYGDYDEVVLDEARKLGLKIHFVLSDGIDNYLDQGVVGRMLIVDHPDTVAFANLLATKTAALPRRFVELSLDRFVGKTSEEQETILSDLLERIAALKVNTVIVSPVTPDGRKAYIATTVGEPVTDIMDRVLHQIRTRLNIRTVVLKFPAKLRMRDAATFFGDLARLTRFDAVLFPADADAEQVRVARDVMHRTRARIKFGVDGDTPRRAEYDFIVLSALPNNVSAIDASRIWVRARSVDALQQARDTSAPTSADQIVNYGFPLDWGTPVGQTQRDPQEAAGIAARVGR